MEQPKISEKETIVTVRPESEEIHIGSLEELQALIPADQQEREVEVELRTSQFGDGTWITIDNKCYRAPVGETIKGTLKIPAHGVKHGSRNSRSWREGDL